MPDYENMSEEELGKLIEEKYGEDWTIQDLNPDDELTKAFISSIETGV